MMTKSWMESVGSTMTEQMLRLMSSFFSLASFDLEPNQLSSILSWFIWSLWGEHQPLRCLMKSFSRQWCCEPAIRLICEPHGVVCIEWWPMSRLLIVSTMSSGIKTVTHVGLTEYNTSDELAQSYYLASWMSVSVRCGKSKTTTAVAVRCWTISEYIDEYYDKHIYIKNSVLFSYSTIFFITVI